MENINKSTWLQALTYDEIISIIEEGFNNKFHPQNIEVTDIYKLIGHRFMESLEI